jgi:hypothetical protein
LGRPKYEDYEIDYGRYGVGEEEEEEEGDGARARWTMWAIMGMGRAVLKQDPSPDFPTDKVDPARGWGVWGRNERLKSGKRIEKKEASIPTATGRAAGKYSDYYLGEAAWGERKGGVEREKSREGRYERSIVCFHKVYTSDLFSDADCQGWHAR